MRSPGTQPYSDEHTDYRVMDLHLPDAEPNGATVLLIHGGGFTGGDKEAWTSVAAWFCARGYACASVNYRLAPTWRFPAWVEDARLAMACFAPREPLGYIACCK